MDVLDVVVAALFGLAIVSGWRRGLLWVVLSYLGLAAGVIAGSAMAPPLAHLWGGNHRTRQSLVGVMVFLVCVALLQSIGILAGHRLRSATTRTTSGRVDSATGAGLGWLGTLVAMWYVGLSFVNFSQAPLLVGQIQHSGILRSVDSLAPRPPAVLSRYEQLLGSQTFPNPFAGLAAPQLPDAAPPAASQLESRGVTLARSMVAQVASSGCRSELGTAWPVSAHLWVTNAHVVAGSQSVTVRVPNRGVSLPARVVLFDPKMDLAVLLVQEFDAVPLPVAAGDPDLGVQGAVIGYPGGGDQKTVVAAVKGEVQAEGRDIYGSGLVARRLAVLHAVIIPGNSGGPIVDLGGNVVGVVFAVNASRADEGYALSPVAVSHDVALIARDTSPVSTQGCTE